MGFIDILTNQDHEENVGITFVDPHGETFLSYGELCRRVPEWAAVLAAKGVRREDPVVFQISDNKDLVMMFWAVLWLGAIPVPMAPARTAVERDTVARVCGFFHRYFVASDTSSVEPLLEAEEYLDTVAIRAEVDSGTYPSDLYRNPITASMEDTRIIQFSSGSTGVPKGIMVSEGNLIHGLEALVPARRARVKNSMLTWLPLTHNLSLIGVHVYSILQNYGQVLMPTHSFVMNPLAWLQAVTTYRPTVTMCPNFAFGYVLRALHAHPEVLSALDLSSIHKIMCGSEPVDPDLAAQFQRELRQIHLRNNAINTGYGLSEACLMVSVTDIYQPMKVLRLDRSRLFYGCTVAEAEDPEGAAFVSVGHPAPGVHLTIRNDAGGLLEEGAIGEIYIAGSPVAQRVLTPEGIQEQPFTSDGALATGDMGLFYEGELFVVGRIKDIIFVGGKNYYSNDLEKLLEAEIGVECAVVGATDASTQTEIVCVFPVRTEGVSEAEVEKGIKRVMLGKLAVPVDRIMWINALPKTSTGKRARQVLREMI